MATLSDIAKHCGTSLATTSYVLGGNGDKHKISQNTQQRILNAAEELGYQRKQPKQKSQIITECMRISVFYPNNQLEATIAETIGAIGRTVRDEIIPIDLTIKLFEQGQINLAKDFWNGNLTDAAVVVSASESDLEYLSSAAPKIPIVLVNKEFEGLSSVTNSNELIAQMAISHALRNGEEDIVLVSNAESFLSIKKRVESMLIICEQKGINMENKVYSCRNSADDGYELGQELIRKNKLPKVIICVHDMVGFGIISALNEGGIKVGTDVQVIATSSGLSSIFARSYPSMTVIDLKAAELMSKSIRLAAELARKTVISPQRQEIMPEIIYRMSSPYNYMPKL